MLLAAAGFAQHGSRPAGRSPFFSIKDVRPGLHATGKTVFSGDHVEEFRVTILGVLENQAPGQSLILARLAGGPLENTGVLQGMSGSPVYVDGRLLGAISMAFPFSKEPIAAIRPIEEMVRPGVASARRAARRISLDDQSLAAAFAPAQPLGFGDSRMVDIATPVSFSGFTRSTLERFAGQLRGLGLEPAQGISGGSTAAAARRSGRPLEPGEMISVQLLSGDMSIAADGTVTHVEGDRVWAFGHRLLSLGATELPFARASVIALLPNLNTSFKIATTGEWLGTISSDTNAAISGRLGRRTRGVPVSIRVHGVSGGSSYSMEMINDRLLSPLLLQMAVYSAIDATERGIGLATIGIKGKVEFDGGLQPLEIENMFAGEFNVPMQVSLATAVPLAWLLQNNLDAPRLKSVSLTLDAAAGRKQLHIDQVWLSKREVRPGEEIEIAALLLGDNGTEMVKRTRYAVPTGAPAGPLYFTVADGATINNLEGRQAVLAQPRPAAQLVSFLNGLRGNRHAYVRVWRANPAFQIDADDLPDPPGSIGAILTRQQGGTVIPRSSKVTQIELPVGDYVVTGSKTVQVDIKG
ncbi:MAG: hypothetical protein HYS04_22190 [Acidobacteria bacterium]|nr:hypothetical protein [Acidobacteriota bacterium]